MKTLNEKKIIVIAAMVIAVLVAALVGTGFKAKELNDELSAQAESYEQLTDDYQALSDEKDRMESECNRMHSISEELKASLDDANHKITALEDGKLENRRQFQSLMEQSQAEQAEHEVIISNDYLEELLFNSKSNEFGK